MHQSSPSAGSADGYTDHGHAWTFAYQRDVNRYLSVALEYLQMDSRLTRRLEFGLPDVARERELELALRLQL